MNKLLRPIIAYPILAVIVVIAFIMVLCQVTYEVLEDLIFSDSWEA